MILYYQDAANGPTYYLTQIPYDFFIVTNRTAKTIVITNAVSPGTSANLNNVTNVLYGGYSFVTNVLFYDWREGWSGGSGVNSGKGKAVQAVQIDVTKFNIWLTNSTALSNGGSTYYNQCKQSNHKSHPINSIYVYNSVPLSSTTLPAVRLANGEKLPSQVAPYGFTVATPMPMYVWSHYNAATDAGTSRGKNSTTYTLPAALMADSITILSAGWTDASPTTKRPAAQTTTVNAAMVEGIVRSTNSLYSGGLENFLRLLEGWGSIDLWYNGSIVVMFPSQYATNYWVAPGGYYDAPGRKWAFDTNFTVQAKLPPLTPQSKGVIRANWAAGK
jgi:hypothetical protein